MTADNRPIVPIKKPKVICPGRIVPGPSRTPVVTNYIPGAEGSRLIDADSADAAAKGIAAYAQAGPATPDALGGFLASMTNGIAPPVATPTLRAGTPPFMPPSNLTPDIFRE